MVASRVGGKRPDPPISRVATSTPHGILCEVALRDAQLSRRRPHITLQIPEEAGPGSDLMSATGRWLPRIDGMMFCLAGWVKRPGFRSPQNDATARLLNGGWGGGGRSAFSIAPKRSPPFSA